MWGQWLLHKNLSNAPSWKAAAVKGVRKANEGEAVSGE
jgi:hypothetical protein